VAGFSGDGGRATEAQLRGPTGIAVASDGTLYIGDSLNNRVRRVTPDGMISTIAGTGVRGFSGDGGPAVAASLNIPAQVVADGGGNLYVADFFSGHVRKVSAAGIITTVAGNGDIAQTDIPFPPVGDGGPAIQATLRDVTAVVADPAGNLVVADFLGNRVRKIAPDGTISSLGAIDGPVGLALDGQGAIYVSTGDSRVRKIDSNGTISLFAGTGTGTGLIRSQGDGGPATSATLNEPKQIAVDASGNLYIADTSNARLRRVDTKGIIQTVSGPGQQGVDYWNGVAIDGTGAVFVATTHALTTGGFSQVQRLNADGSLTPIAGNGQFCTGSNTEFPYDGQAAVQIPLCVVTAITFDSRGMLYISEPYYGAVLQMAPDGTIRRIAGSLLANTAGDGGPVLKASLNGEGAPSPGAVAVDAAGNLYIPQALASRLREVPVTEMVMKLSTNAINWTGAQSQTIQVTTNFAVPMPYLVRLESDGGWLTANRSSGRTGEALLLTGDPTGLTPGVHHGKVTITLPGAALESSAAVTFTVL
jgi:sugar lactone lactonase YvrE